MAADSSCDGRFAQLLRERDQYRDILLMLCEGCDPSQWDNWPKRLDEDMRLALSERWNAAQSSSQEPKP